MTKSDQTKKLINQTFLELLKNRPLSSITIKDLTTAASINRNTFYYYYKNIPDLLESLVKNFVDDVLTKHPPTYDSFEDCLLVAIDFARENRESIYHIYNSANRFIFERYLWKICEYTVTSYINSFPTKNPEIADNLKFAENPGIANNPKFTENPEIAEEELELLIDILKFESFGFTMDWITKGMPEGVTEKITLLSNSIKSQIRHLPNF